MDGFGAGGSQLGLEQVEYAAGAKGATDVAGGGPMKIRLIVAATALLLAGFLTAPVASAQYVGGTPPPAGKVVKPIVQVQGGTPTAVRVQAGQARRARSFALTGADVAQMVLIGGAMVVGGTVLVRHSRRRVTPTIS